MKPDLQLKRRLDALYTQGARRTRAADDPVDFVHRFRRLEDVEVAALIAAAFSYGRVGLFKPVVARVLAALGPSPHGALISFDPVSVRSRLAGVSYRFNRTDDIAAFLALLSQTIYRHGSLGGAFFDRPGSVEGRNFDRRDKAKEALAHFRAEIFSGSTAMVYGRDLRPNGLTQLLHDTSTGSAAKRMYMFLRWMVRRDAVDPGPWAAFGAENLVMPLDTHVARIARNLGLTRRKTADYRMAVEITDALRRLDPAAPVKYDFALAHLGISGACPSRPSADACARCALRPHCRPKVRGRRAARRRGPRS